MRPCLLSLALLSGISPTAHAQAGSSPCRHPDILHATERGQQVRISVLYDGVAALKRSPATAIPFPVEIPDGSCVLLSVQFSVRDGQVYVEDAGFMSVTPRTIQMQMRRYDYSKQVVRAATEVVRNAARQDLFPVGPKDKTRYIVAVPLVRSHPLFAQGAPPAMVAAASGVPSSLRERGYPAATLLKAEQGMALYRLGERGSTQYLAIVRRILPDEPILDYTTQIEQGLRVTRYGSREETRFRTVVAPALRDRGELFQDIVIYHYADGITLVHEPDSRFPWNRVQHFQTGDLVEPPVAAEHWTGRRRSPGGPFTWSSAGERGTSATDLNTIAAIESVQRQMTDLHQQQAAYREALYRREAEELASRRATRQRREAERAGLVTRAGLRYLPAATWSRYQLGPEMKLVFDGTWRGGARDWEFGNIYARTIRAFSNRCRRLIPPDSPLQISTPVSRDDLGNERRGTPDTTFIPRAFFEPFRWWDQNLPQAIPLAPPGSNLGDPIGLLNAFASPAEALQGIFSGSSLLLRVQIAMREDMAVLFEEGCESPTVKQFMENMRRLALGLPSLQEERVPQSLLRADEWPLSLGDACRKHQAERGAAVNRDWCPCLERELSRSMTLGDRWEAVDDYHRFFDEVEGLRPGSDGQPVWARYTPANACRR